MKSRSDSITIDLIDPIIVIDDPQLKMDAIIFFDDKDIKVWILIDIGTRPTFVINENFAEMVCKRLNTLRNCFAYLVSIKKWNPNDLSISFEIITYIHLTIYNYKILNQPFVEAFCKQDVIIDCQ